MPDKIEEAMVRLARQIAQNGSVAYQGLEGADRTAANRLISARAVKAIRDKEGFIVMRPRSAKALFGWNSDDEKANVILRLAAGL